MHSETIIRHTVLRNVLFVFLSLNLIESLFVLNSRSFKWKHNVVSHHGNSNHQESSFTLLKWSKWKSNHFPLAGKECQQVIYNLESGVTGTNPTIKSH